MIESVSDPLAEQADAMALKRTRRKTGDRQHPAQSIDRLPPHSIESEQGVLGCCLLDPNFCLDILANKWAKCGKLAFYDLRHQLIYDCLVTKHSNSEPIDLITVQQWLKDRELLAQVGGIPYLSKLQDTVPSAANVEYYAQFVFEKYILRQYIAICSGTVGRIYDHEGDIDTLAGEIESEILKIHDTQSADFVIPKPQTLVNEVITSIETAWASDGAPSGLSTGFPDWDKCTDGLHKGEMFVIAARPSIGKTALAVNVAENVAIDQGKAVGVFSLEMTAPQLIERMMASQAKVNIRALKKDMLLAPSDSPKLTMAAGKVGNAKVLIDDTPGLSILQLRARARRMAKAQADKGDPIVLWVIDYLQLLHSTTVSKSDNREREISDISQGIKAMAKELDVPVIVLSQLNRESEKTGGKPKISQLRESGAIEQDADTIGLMYEDNNQDEPSTQTEHDAGKLVHFLIAKQRHGERYVTINFTFMKHWTRFESQSLFNAADIPTPNYLPPQPHQGQFLEAPEND